MQKFPFKAALSLTAFSAAMLIASAPAEAREITAAVATGFTTLDPWDAVDNLSRAVSRSFYESLYTFDKDLKPVPQLAESYEVSKDGLTYTFRLRQGVKFHDGTEFTADAVKMNFDRGMNPDSKLTRRTFFKFVDRGLHSAPRERHGRHDLPEPSEARHHEAGDGL